MFSLDFICIQGFDMHQHRNLAARVNIVMGWIGIACAILAMVVIFVFFAWASSDGMGFKEAATGNALGMMALIVFALAVLQLLFSVTQLSGGEKILAGEKGMTGLMIVSIISLFAFPIGTIVGAYTIWVLIAGQNTLGIPSAVNLHETEQTARYGITHNGKYFACGEMHFDNLDHALEYARGLERQNSRA